ncbi:hypothetical protein Droror1_Dr00001444 [Drosera rotundifolia]
MDACEEEEELGRSISVGTPRRTLVQSDTNDGGIASRCRTGVVSSRNKSPTTPAAAAVSRRSQSPKVARTVNPLPLLAPKRAVSAERKRPSTPPSPIGPSTPVQDTNVELSSRKVAGSRLPEGLWPSTMRSLSVSFQSDTISIPVSKKEKPASHTLSDRALKSSSNVAHRQGETTSVVRKPTPERKRSPMKGKGSSNQSENSRPDALQSWLIDQHRWPSRASGKVTSNLLSRGLDLGNKSSKSSNSSFSTPGKSSLRRLSDEGIPRPSVKSTSDAESLSLMEEIREMELDMKSIDDMLVGITEMRRLSTSSTNSSEKAAPVTPKITTRLLPGTRLPSPSRTSTSRGMASPSRTRPSTPTASRGTSPSRIQPSSPTRKPSSTSVLSFIVDIKKGKKGANQLDDAHQLRLFYNRYLQWRFANACADDVLSLQKITVEQTLYNVWRTTLSLRESLITKQIELQRLQLELNLNLVLSEQLAYLEDWALLERDHSTSLAGVVKDLEASTLRVPVTGGAKTDTESLKAAISSALDVMQAMGSSVSSVLPKVEETHYLVSELAERASYEKTMLDESESLLASLAVLQVREQSLRTQLIQLQQDLTNKEQPI